MMIGQVEVFRPERMLDGGFEKAPVSFLLNMESLFANLMVCTA